MPWHALGMTHLGHSFVIQCCNCRNPLRYSRAQITNWFRSRLRLCNWAKKPARNVFSLAGGVYNHSFTLSQKQWLHVMAFWCPYDGKYLVLIPVFTTWSAVYGPTSGYAVAKNGLVSTYFLLGSGICLIKLSKCCICETADRDGLVVWTRQECTQEKPA
jgi:hypothetical protein